jgi:hypothetical protein
VRLRSGSLLELVLVDSGQPVSGHAAVDFHNRPGLLRLGGIVSLSGTRVTLQSEHADPPTPLTGWLREASLAESWVRALDCTGMWFGGPVTLVARDHVELLTEQGPECLLQDAVDLWVLG